MNKYLVIKIKLTTMTSRLLVEANNNNNNNNNKESEK